MRAGIVVTGTEVLTGTISDANGPWLSERLAELGIDVAHILIVGDRPDDLEAALRFMAGEGMDLIVTSGGLGPTADDLTAEVVARFAGRDLLLDEEVEEKIAEILRGFARRFNFDEEAVREANRKQALVPEGATAARPGRHRPRPRRPGRRHGRRRPARARRGSCSRCGRRRSPPRRCARSSRGRPRCAATRCGCSGSPSPKSRRACARSRATASPSTRSRSRPACGAGEIEVEVRYRDEAAATADAVREGLRERHERHLFSLDGETIDSQVAKLLAGRTLGLAESCSGGLMAARITNVPGASAYFAGGVVSYSNEAKAELLGVDPALIEAHGAVSPEVAEAMARGALERFGADIAVAITGIAGPDGGTEEKPVGYVCFHALLAEGPAIARDPVIPGGREDIRERSALVGMHLLRMLLTGGEPPL